MSVCFCTLAFGAPYRRRARRLRADLAPEPFLVLTDGPDDFANASARTILHQATGPMALDYMERFVPIGYARGVAAYHDKRFALMAALRDFDTAIFVDADTRVAPYEALDDFPAGLVVLPGEPETVVAHLLRVGPWRLPVFRELSRLLLGDVDGMASARWCTESCLAITKDEGREARFFEAWGRAAAFLQEHRVYSGEGGVIGLAALFAGWTVDDHALARFALAVDHEGGGPKDRLRLGQLVRRSIAIAKRTIRPRRGGPR